MPGPTRVLIFAAPLLLILASVPARAGEVAPAASASQAAPTAQALPTLLAAQPATGQDSLLARVAAAPLSARIARSPLMTAIAAVMDDEGVQLQPLFAELARSRDASRSLELQRRIEQVKQGTELQMLRVQSGFARAAGNTALADRIDDAIAEQLRPRQRLEPQARPAPAAGDVR